MGRDVDGVLSTEEDIAKYTNLARKLVLAAWPKIVRGLIEKATDGNYQQAKLLVELCELTHADANELNEHRKQQLCDVLLDELLIEPDLDETNLPTLAANDAARMGHPRDESGLSSANAEDDIEDKTDQTGDPEPAGQAETL